MSVFFEHQCGLMALAKATLASESYIAEPRVDLPDLYLLAFSMFPDPSASVSDPPVSTETYKDKVDRGELVIKNIGSTILNIEQPEGMGQQLVEVVRADFDGDGVEDILLFEDCYATHGTLGLGRAPPSVTAVRHGSVRHLDHLARRLSFPSKRRRTRKEAPKSASDVLPIVS